ncbi:hypothetical protein NLG97_g2536 [Lecanicillium saksenae]|uniref:Uncharacterized protein n=1 Tax=Lecanicillium saksenae TaxID=468837 RepID=A0ACC1R0V1_9HYPO|nr:hypothetical protein NLG97_g2536 [Lecanicillium saksenae]
MGVRSFFVHTLASHPFGVRLLITLTTVSLSASFDQEDGCFARDEAAGGSQSPPRGTDPPPPYTAGEDDDFLHEAFDRLRVFSDETQAADSNGTRSAVNNAQLAVASRLLGLNNEHNHPDQEALRAMAYLYNPERIIVSLRIVEMAKKQPGPFADAFQNATGAGVVLRISVAIRIFERFQDPYAPGLETLSHSDLDKMLANFVAMPTLPEGITTESMVTVNLLHSFAVKSWETWCLAWKLTWKIVFNPLLKNPDPTIWGPQLAALLQGKPHMILQLFLRSVYGKEAESQEWWMNRNGVEKRMLDKIVPLQDSVLKHRLKYEAAFFGF